MIALLFAILATFADHSSTAIERCTPVVIPGTFVGCEDRTSSPEDDPAYAGLVWIDGEPVLQTGP